MQTTESLRMAIEMLSANQLTALIPTLESEGLHELAAEYKDWHTERKWMEIASPCSYLGDRIRTPWKVRMVRQSVDVLHVELRQLCRTLETLLCARYFGNDSKVSILKKYWQQIPLSGEAHYSISEGLFIKKPEPVQGLVKTLFPDLRDAKQEEDTILLIF